MRHSERQYYVITAIMLLGIATYQLIHLTGFVVYPDEFGYWANAAQFLGYDWSGAVSLQSYYSFGYSILLIPFLKMFSNPVVMYKAAIILNIIFVYLYAVLIWKVSNRLRPDCEKQNFFFCIAAVFYPSVIFYMQMTWTECLLTLLFVWSLWLILQYSKTKKVLYGVLFIGCLGYMYLVHMRVVGVFAAGMLLLIYLNKKDWRKTVGFLVIAAALVIVGICIKEYLQGALYIKTDKALLNTNDYTGKIDIIKYALTAEGIGKLAVSCIGKFFYLGVSTWGTIYFGIWHILKRIRKEPIFLYLLLAAGFTFGITAVFMMGGGRADAFFYGRYNEFVLPIFIYFGLCEMAENKYIGRITLGIILLQGGMAYILIQAMATTNPQSYIGCFAVGVSYVLKEWQSRIQDYVLLPLAAGAVTTVLLALVMGVFIRKKKIMIVYLTLFIGLSVYTAVSAGNKYLYNHSIDVGNNIALAEYAKTKMQDEDRILFINSGGEVQLVDSLQFCFRETPIEVVSEEEVQLTEKNKPEFVFTYHNSKKEKLLRKYYDTVMETYHFKLYYNRGKK